MTLLHTRGSNAPGIVIRPIPLNSNYKLVSVVHTVVAIMAYFNAKSGEVVIGTHELLIEPSTDEFSHLPIDAILKIFTFLDARSLCRCSRVQRSWYNLSNMERVWGYVLERDRMVWKTVGYKSHLKRSGEDNYSKKQIYMLTRPEVALKKCPVGMISDLLKRTAKLVRTFVPKCILFGSGLESTQLVRNWLLGAEASSPFQCAGYTQGVNGIGAGVLVDLTGFGSMNVITLYNATWAERKAIVAGERPRINRLLEDPNTGTAKETGDEMSYEDSVKIIPQIRELCHNMDLAVFAVDTNQPREQYRVDKTEMRAMMGCAPSKTPIMILNIQSEPTAPIGTSSLEVCRLLELDKLERPWLVHEMCATEQSGLVAGVKWCMQELDMI